jgi:hypothetical protein
MDNTNGIEQIKHLYEKLTYFDYYGSSIIFLILISIVFFILCSYCFIMINIEPIKNDWPNQRCKPYVMPFAGMIAKPDDMSYADFTSQNFTFCSQNVINGGTGKLLEPLTFVISTLVAMVDTIKNSLNSIREMTDKVRTNIQNVSQEIMGRLINIMVPLQQIIIGFKDIIAKVQGTLTASLMTVLGSYYALRSLMGSIAELIIRFLIGLVVTIIICWANPLGWAVAPVLTGTFVAISIYMTVIIVFLTVVLKVEPALKLPKLNKCFDKNTVIAMNDGTKKKIGDIKVGDKLENNNEVTATLKLDAKDTDMYDLNGVIVSGSHPVNYNNSWINVSHHPLAKKISYYNEPYLYCLNTSSKMFTINNICFGDWDEIYEDDINSIRNNKHFDGIENIDIHKYTDGGFSRNTQIKLKNGTVKSIQDIQINDILDHDEIVYGIVEINGIDLYEQCKYNLGNNTFVEGGSNLVVCDKRVNFTSTLDLDGSNKEVKTIKEKILYHILTDKKTFYCNNVRFCDYNASIESLIDKYSFELQTLREIQH